MKSRPFISWNVRLLLILSFLILSVCSVFADTLPSTLFLVKDKAVLENCTYNAGATLTNIQGQGNLVLRYKILNDNYEYMMGKVNIVGITSDASGQILSGTLNIPAVSVNDVAGSGVSIDAANGSVVSKMVGGKWTAEFSFSSMIELPFKDGRGNSFKADFQTGKTVLSVDSSGAVALNASGGKSPGMLVGPPAPGSKKNDGYFESFGIKVEPLAMNIVLSASETSASKFETVFPTGFAYTSIPKLLTLDDSELKLQFNNLKINESGEITAQNMTIPGGAQCDVALSDPAGFVVSIQKAVVSVDHSKNSAFFLYTSVILPNGVTDDKGGRVGLPYTWVDMLNNPVIDMSKPISAPTLSSSDESESETTVARSGNSNRFKMSLAGNSSLSTNRANNAVRANIGNIAGYIQMAPTHINFNGYGADISDLVVDLSRVGPDNYAVLTPSIMSAKWQGVFARKASVTLPVETWKTEDGKLVTVLATNCFIDSNGFNGEIEASADSLKGVNLHGFNPKLNKLHVIFGRSSVLMGDCTGSASVPGFEGTLPLTIKIGDVDASAKVSDPSTITDKKLGLTICAMSGSLLPGSDDKYALWLNGAIVLDVPGYESLKNAALAFHDLGIDNGGRFVTTSDGRLNLDVPADVDFGPFRCNLSSLAFCIVNGSDPNKPKWYVDMNGEMSLNNDFPVSSSLDYKYLQIVEGASNPEVSYSDIKVVADVLDVVRISSTLNRGDEAKYGKCLFGDADLDLLFAGDPVPLKPEGDSPAKFHLRLGERNVWAVAGEVDLPVEIPLGTTGLGLYRFEGGIAHNMSAPDGAFSDVMQLTPKPDSDSWLFMGGCRVCVKDNRNLFHADGTLTIGLPDFAFGIDGDAWFFTDSEEKPGQVQVNVLMDPSVPLFKVSAGLDLGIPEKWIMEIQGNVELQMAPGDTHLAIGWPYPDNAVQSSVLGGVLNPRCGAYFTPTTGRVCAGESWNYWVFSGNIDADLQYNFANQPYFAGSIWASGSVDFYIASLGASASLEAQLFEDYLWYSGAFTATIGTPWPLPDIHVSVDFTGTL